MSAILNKKKDNFCDIILFAFLHRSPLNKMPQAQEESFCSQNYF